MRSPLFVVLLLLSFALSKSITEHERLETKDTKAPVKVSSVPPLDFAYHNRAIGKDNHDSVPVETLFIPEDYNRYEEILARVQELFERVEQSSDQGILQEPDRKERVRIKEDQTENTNRDETWPIDPESQFSTLESLWERNSGLGLARTNAEGNGEAEITSLERNKDDPDEEDFLEAANFGLEAMKELYTIKEPMLYSNGIYLDSDNPARHVALFNGQTEEARALSKFGFAVLQGTTRFKRKFPDASTDSLLSRRSQSNLLQRHCPNRGVPVCPPASLRYRTSDGSCNNLEHLWWGSAMSTMQRFLPASYDDGIQSIRRSVTGRRLPGAREVTTVIHEDRDIPLASVTHMLMQWGQFVDHDLTATGQSRGFNGTVPQCCLRLGSGFQPPEFMHPECLPIPVSLRDNFFGPLGVRCLEFVRSGPAPKEDCEFGPREQLTQVTSYLDASTVYSSNAFHTDALRLFRNGLLQYGRLQSQRPVLPKLDADLCKLGSLSTDCFRAGDGRLGEQPALTSLHIAFLRLHNRIATKLAALNPHWSDEKLFQETRRIVGAIVQHITYREFLPIVLGQDVMEIFDLELLKKGYYEGYDPKVNPTIANSFSTAAYRFGHSLVQRSFVRFDSQHRPIFNNVSIHKEFTNPANLETAGSVDRLLLGLINQPSQRRDEHISEELTNHLFQTPGFPFGMDLASINVQRGRDHGISSYVKWREPCGLSPIKSFEDLDRTMPSSTARKFRLIYSSVEDIDLFSGGLAEKSVKGGLVGPTFACIIGQQFSNLRKGDRFWYENPGQENSFTPGQLQQIRRVSLAQVLCATMDNIETIQPFVFLIADNLKNQRLPCNDPSIGQLDLEFWAERPPEIRSRILEKFRRTTTLPSTRAKPSATEDPKTLPQLLKPPKSSVHQQNRIIVKRPLGPSDNVTIVVQNNAINSPVFVNDAIYGSSIKVNPSLQQQSNSPNPVFDFSGQRPLQTFSEFLPPPRPIPTSPPPMSLFYMNPYVPYAFKDPSNPNPLSHGYKSAYLTDDVVYESFPATSPRPTLYTYYTNFQRGTQRPQIYATGHETHQTIEPTHSTFPRPESFDRLTRPVYDSQGNQQSTNYHGSNGAWHQSSINRPNDFAYSSSHDSASANHQTPPDKQIEYATWSSVSSYHSDRPVYQPQSTGRPVQIKQSEYQQGSTESTASQNYRDQFFRKPTDRIKIDDSTVNPEKPNIQNDDYYHSTKPKPSKIHSVTVLGTETSQEIDRVENRVTGEIPRPLATGINDKAVNRKPGQYYYEKNVLHRYPDKIEDSKESEQRRKVDQLIRVSSRNPQITDENRNDTIASQPTDSYSEKIEDAASTNRTSHWMNPREDSSLPSALELPKISSDDSIVAKELPKPIKLGIRAS